MAIKQERIKRKILVLVYDDYIKVVIDTLPDEIFELSLLGIYLQARYIWKICMLNIDSVDFDVDCMLARDYYAAQ